MKSIKTKFFIEKCFSGVNFIALGIWWFSREHNWNLWSVDVILGAVIIVNFLLQTIIMPKLRFEPVDEMTKSHEQRSQAITYTTVCMILSLLGLLCIINKTIRTLFFSLRLSWTYLFVALGIMQIVEYINFLLIEGSADPIE